MKESLTELRHIEKELDHEDEEFSMNTSTDNQLNYAIKLLNG